MSQPAVTQAVMKIEAWAGCRFFYRNQTGTTLTDEGRIFVACIRRLFAQIEAALAGGILRGVPKAALHKTASRLKSSHIKVLAAVAESSSFEDAAVSLGMSRTALQRTARGLELILGSELYERTPHGLATNALARALAISLAGLPAAAGRARRDRGAASQELLADLHRRATPCLDLAARHRHQ
jgi:LysR family transcriptional regulator, regulator for genes of the gallate degradation pathway